LCGVPVISITPLGSSIAEPLLEHHDLRVTPFQKVIEEQFDMFFIGTLVSLVSVIVVYLWLVNQAIVQVPPDVQKISPRRWTKKGMKETYERISREPIDFTPHLPPKLDRRYVVVGSSGR
jgi:hypothetical protein